MAILSQCPERIRQVQVMAESSPVQRYGSQSTFYLNDDIEKAVDRLCNKETGVCMAGDDEAVVSIEADIKPGSVGDDKSHLELGYLSAQRYRDKYADTDISGILDNALNDRHSHELGELECIILWKNAEQFLTEGRLEEEDKEDLESNIREVIRMLQDVELPALEPLGIDENLYLPEQIDQVIQLLLQSPVSEDGSDDDMDDSMSMIYFSDDDSISVASYHQGAVDSGYSSSPTEDSSSDSDMSAKKASLRRHFKRNNMVNLYEQVESLRKNNPEMKPASWFLGDEEQPLETDL